MLARCYRAGREHFLDKEGWAVPTELSAGCRAHWWALPAPACA